MAKKKSVPTSMAASMAATLATTGLAITRATNEDERLIDTSGAPDDTPDDTFEATVQIVRSSIVEFIIKLCKFPEDSTMVAYIDQQGWSDLVDITTIGIDEIKDFFTVKDDGVTYDAKPMLVHLRLFKCFMLYYKRQCRELYTTLTEDDIMFSFSRSRFEDYCGSDKYNDDLAGVSKPSLTPDNTGNAVHPGEMTVQEFRRGVKRDKLHYGELKDDKYFNSWNRGFVATAHMHHTNVILNETYVPRTANERDVFQEIQTFMFAVMEEKLKSEKGKSLISKYEDTRDAQSVYRELKKHALESTAALLSGDTLLQYISTARYPGTWRGNSFNFVLHFKEQLMKYEKLELEVLPPKHKLRLLQNAVGEISELAYVKQIGDQNIAQGNQPLAYDTYMELLLSACSTYDKKIALPGKQKRAVYVSEFESDTYTDTYEAYRVDTDVEDIMAHATDTNRSGNRPPYGSNKTFIPWDQWTKLSQEQKDKLIAERQKERMNNVHSKPRVPYPPRQANVHNVDESVDIDDIIDYTILNHEVALTDDDTKGTSTDNDSLLAYMAGRSSSRVTVHLMEIFVRSWQPRPK